MGCVSVGSVRRFFLNGGLWAWEGEDRIGELMGK